MIKLKIEPVSLFFLQKGHVSHYTVMPENLHVMYVCCSQRSCTLSGVILRLLFNSVLPKLDIDLCIFNLCEYKNKFNL